MIRMDSKAALRLQARARLGALSPAARAAASAEIRRLLQAHPAWAAAPNIALYAAQPSEPNLTPLLSTPGKTLCLPRVSGQTLAFHHSTAPLQPGPWNLLEPHPDHSPLVDPSDIKLFTIPGLAFTKSGARLGRGGGFYDRFLAQAHPKAVKIGVCFETQIVPALPMEDHDHTMDWVVTESGMIRCGDF